MVVTVKIRMKTDEVTIVILNDIAQASPEIPYNNFNKVTANNHHSCPHKQYFNFFLHSHYMTCKGRLNNRTTCSRVYSRLATELLNFRNIQPAQRTAVCGNDQPPHAQSFAFFSSLSSLLHLPPLLSLSITICRLLSTLLQLLPTCYIAPQLPGTSHHVDSRYLSRLQSFLRGEFCFKVSS